MILMITNQKAKDQIIFRVSTEALKIQLQNPDIGNQKGVGVGGKVFTDLTQCTEYLAK